jgi:outer membrane protein assembly factor BamB
MRFTGLAVVMLLALSGCGLWDSWFGTEKTPLPGTRVAVLVPSTGLEIASGSAVRVTLPRPAANAAWPQAGGVASHDMEHPALADAISRAWSSGIGAGGGYRRKITAQPIVASGLVFTMDSDAVVAAFDAATGRQAWSTSTEDAENRSTNIGGGIAFDGGIVYAATGRADLLALDAASGAIKWRVKLPAGARAAPTVVEGRLFIPLIDSQLVAFAAADGAKAWTYQASSAEPIVLGLPSPAFALGLLVAGFGSGELVALNPTTGSAVWSESLAAARGRTSLADVSSVRGRAVIKDGRVYAVSLGQQLAALDLRSGRRLWEREVGSAETPWVAGDYLFLVTADARVTAIALADGQVAWVTQLDAYENMEKKTDPIRWLGPVLAGDRLVLAGTDGTALSLSPYTGQILGKQELSGKASVAPVVAGGTLYIVTDDATLAAFR